MALKIIGTLDEDNKSASLDFGDSNNLALPSLSGGGVEFSVT